MLTPRWAADRFTLLTLALLVLVTAAAWAGVVYQAASMAPMDMAGMDMPGMNMPRQTPPGRPLIDVAGLVPFVGAWGVMMAAMMLPSALPLILLYRTAASKQAAGSSRLLPTWTLVGGYLLVWIAFGVPVYIASQVVDATLASETALV